MKFFLKSQKKKGKVNFDVFFKPQTSSYNI